VAAVNAKVSADVAATTSTVSTPTSKSSYFDPSNQVISALGAVAALVTLTLLIVTGYFIYQVYVRGELRLKEQPASSAKNHETIDEERVVQNIQNGEGPGGSPNKKNNLGKSEGGKPVDHNEIRLDDVKPEVKAPPKPIIPAAGGVSGVAFQDKFASGLASNLADQRRRAF
jgi:hypothetical protein